MGPHLKSVVCPIQFKNLHKKDPASKW